MIIKTDKLPICDPISRGSITAKYSFILIHLCIFVLFVCCLVSAQGHDHRIGYCNEVTAVPTMEQPPPPSRAPLTINAMFDAVIISGVPEPYNIDSDHDELEFFIDGGSHFTVTLTHGTAQSAQDIANDLNNNSTFSNQAEADDLNDYLFIRSNGGSTLGSIDIHGSACSRVSISSGYHGPSMYSAERNVVWFAVGEWEDIIEDAGSLPNPYPIRFAFYPFMDPVSTTLGSAYTQPSSPTGIPLWSRISMNGNNDWFIDPTPGNDSEYETYGTDPPDGWDFLTVMRHEIGHAVGILRVTTGTNISRFMSGSTFDPTRLNIAYSTTSAHMNPADNPTGHPNDLMVPTTPDKTRRSISLYPDASFVARAHEYDVVMRYVDGDHSGTQNGSATYPWMTFDQANMYAHDRHVLMVADDYLEPVTSLNTGVPNTYTTTRGGTARIMVQGAK